MNGAVVVFIVWMAIVLAVGVSMTRRPPRRLAPQRVNEWAGRLGQVRESSVDVLGRPVTALLLYLAGGAAMLVVLWPLGLLAHAVQTPIDWPTFRWFEARQLHDWSTLWLHLTNIGKPRITQGVDFVAAVVFAAVWARRRWQWWVPLVIFSLGYALEKYGQIILQDVVHRGHPPTTLGTYPSGGCARVLIVYGLVTVFSVLTWTAAGRSAWFAAFAVTAVLWTVQAYARTYNLEHWVTDVIGGSVFGALGLALMTRTTLVLADPRRHRRSTSAVPTAQERQPG